MTKIKGKDKIEEGKKEDEIMRMNLPEEVRHAFLKNKSLFSLFCRMLSQIEKNWWFWEKVLVAKDEFSLILRKENIEKGDPN